MKRKRRRKSNPPIEAAADPKNESKPLRLSLVKKLLFSSMVTILFFGVLEVALAVAGFTPQVAKDDPYVGFASRIPLFVERIGSDGQRRMVTAENKIRWFNRQEFPRTKAAGTVRIFCLGGSTTFGHPYEDNTSFAGWLRELLPAVDSSQKFEVINCGGISYASYRVANLMNELLEYEPDVFIIYTGHNEFLEARTYSTLRQTPDFVLRLGGLVSRTRTYGAMTRLVQRRQAGRSSEQKELLSAEVNTMLDSAVGPVAYHRDDDMHADVLHHFDFNLRRMVQLAESAKAKTIFVTPASNLADCSPFKSEHLMELDAARLKQSESFYASAEERFKARQYHEALRQIEQAIGIDPRFAAALYLRGKILLALNRLDEARTSLIAARDEDVCTLRAPSEFIETVRKVARDTNVPLVDFVRLVEQASPGKIPGENLFLDHVHPTIEGYRDLAVEILPSLREIGSLRGAAEVTTETLAAVESRVMSRVDSTAHGVALRNLSKVLSWAGKKEEADRLALRAIELTPDDSESVYQAANAHVRMGEYDRAIELFGRALELNPGNSATIHASLGFAFGLKGDQAKSIEHYKEALRFNPGFADIHYNLATILEDRKELDEAIAHYQKAIASNPQHYFAQYRLGLAYAMRSQWPAAKSQFENALKLDPSSINAHFCLGQVLANQGDLEGAREHFDWILRRNPNHVDTLAEMRRFKLSP